MNAHIISDSVSSFVHSFKTSFWPAFVSAVVWSIKLSIAAFFGLIALGVWLGCLYLVVQPDAGLMFLHKAIFRVRVPAHSIEIIRVAMLLVWGVSAAVLGACGEVFGTWWSTVVRKTPIMTATTVSRLTAELERVSTRNLSLEAEMAKLRAPLALVPVETRGAIHD